MLMIRPPETGKHSADVIFLILRATSIPEAISITGFWRSPLIPVRTCFHPLEGPNIAEVQHSTRSSSALMAFFNSYGSQLKVEITYKIILCNVLV